MKRKRTDGLPLEMRTIIASYMPFDYRYVRRNLVAAYNDLAPLQYYDRLFHHNLVWVRTVKNTIQRICRILMTAVRSTDDRDINATMTLTENSLRDLRELDYYIRSADEYINTETRPRMDEALDIIEKNIAVLEGIVEHFALRERSQEAVLNPAMLPYTMQRQKCTYDEDEYYPLTPASDQGE